MATHTVRSIEPYVCPNGERHSADGEEASQTYKAGAPLVRDATNKDLEVWAGDTDATLIVGVATRDASGTAGTDVSYLEAREGNMFSATLVSDSGTVALDHGTHLGVAYSLIAQGNNWCVDANDETTKLVEVVDVASGSAEADVNARVVIRFLGDKAANAMQA